MPAFMLRPTARAERAAARPQPDPVLSWRPVHYSAFFTSAPRSFLCAPALAQLPRTAAAMLCRALGTRHLALAARAPCRTVAAAHAAPRRPCVPLRCVGLFGRRAPALDRPAKLTNRSSTPRRHREQRQQRLAVACSAAAAAAAVPPPPAQPPKSKLERIADVATMMFPIWVRRACCSSHARSAAAAFTCACRLAQRARPSLPRLSPPQLPARRPAAAGADQRVHRLLPPRLAVLDERGAV